MIRETRLRQSELIVDIINRGTLITLSRGNQVRKIRIDSPTIELFCDKQGCNALSIGIGLVEAVLNGNERIASL